MLPCVQEISKRQNFIEVMADGLQPVEGDVKIEVYHKEGLGKVRLTWTDATAAPAFTLTPTLCRRRYGRWPCPAP